MNMELFTNGHQSQQVIEHWPKEYNEERSHNSLNYMTPADFADQYRNSSRPTDSLRDGTGEEPRVEQQTTEKPLTQVGP